MATILIVDDYPGVRDILRRTLEGEGHTVTVAADGEGALRHFAAEPADLVICDIYMPGMGGIEFMTCVRRDFPNAKIVVMSGGQSRSEGTMVDAIEALGIAGRLDKPFLARDLIRLVDKALGLGDGVDQDDLEGH